MGNTMELFLYKFIQCLHDDGTATTLFTRTSLIDVEVGNGRKTI